MRFGWLAAGAALMTVQAQAADLVQVSTYWGLQGQTLAGGEKFDPSLGTLTNVKLDFDVETEFALVGSSYDDLDAVETTILFPATATARIAYGEEYFVGQTVVNPIYTFRGLDRAISIFARGSGSFAVDAIELFIGTPNPEFASTNAMYMAAGSLPDGDYTVSGPGTVRYYDIGNRIQVTTTYTYTPFADAVPEPATWAMTIGGFGLAGGALRRRRAGRRGPHLQQSMV